MIRIVTAPAAYPPKHSSGIYKIQCSNGKIYVGSAVCIVKRWGYHKQAEEVRQRVASGIRYQELAREFECSVSTIYNVVLKQRGYSCFV